MKMYLNGPHPVQMRWLIGIALIVLQSTVMAGAQEPDPLQKILDEAFRAEKETGAIRIEGTSLKELWNSNTSTWDQLPFKSEFVLYTSGTLNNRLRIEFNPRIVEWFNGPEPFIAYRSLVASNGSWITQSDQRVDKNKKPLTSPIARITDFKPSRDLFMDLETPIGYTLLNFRGVANQRLWDTDFHNSGFSVTEGEKFEGHTSLVIEQKTSSYRQIVSIVYIDNQPLLKSMRLEGLDKQGTGNGNVTEYTISKYRSIPGTKVFFPAEMRWQESEKHVPMASFTVSISSIERIPEPDKTFFSIPFEVGTRVEDERLGLSFTVGEETGKVIEDIRKQAE